MPSCGLLLQALDKIYLPKEVHANISFSTAFGIGIYHQHLPLEQILDDCWEDFPRKFHPI